ncbi:IclR family transcriptional regulator [Phytohabitans kaempferiae]|uniref:IclR family transcriptional regulator n=1 Tax=Phytohabitans kaempferiae TaxID=1620943 RepID=A0ABV6LWB3_9ACTN
MSQNKESRTVGAVDRALALLTLVSERGPIGVHEAAREIGSAPSTVHRLFATLCQREYLIQGEDRRYRPGPQLLGRRAAVAIPQLVRDARPFLGELHDKVGETVHLMVLVGNHIRLVDGIECAHDLRVTLRLGAEFPAHVTAGGRAMLAELGPDAVAARYAGGIPHVPGRGPTTLAELQHVLAQSPSRKAWLNIDGTEVGMSVISASVGSSAREPLAAMSIAMPTARFQAVDQQAMAATLLEICDRARRHLEGPVLMN